jgi:hypothetical protein
MNTRHYPSQVGDFKREIEPYILSFKNRSGRPSKVGPAPFIGPGWMRKSNFLHFF